MISSKSSEEVRKKVVSEKNLKTTKKKLEDFLRSTLRRSHHFFSPLTLRRISSESTLRKFSDAQQLDSIEET
jgi:hypothetical protein